MNPSAFVNASHAMACIAAKARLAVIQAVAIAEGREDARTLGIFDAHSLQKAHSFVADHFTQTPEDSGRWRPVRALLRDELDARLGLLVRRGA